jgi:hypothetical protein
MNGLFLSIRHANRTLFSVLRTITVINFLGGGSEGIFLEQHLHVTGWIEYTMEKRKSPAHLLFFHDCVVFCSKIVYTEKEAL